MKKSDNQGSARYRKWIFTVIEPAYVVPEGQIKSRSFDEIDYIKIAQEAGEEGKRHLQGYVEFSNKLSLIGVQKRLDFGKCHCEPAFNSEKAQAYIGNLDFVHEDGRVKGGEVFWIFEKGTFVPDDGAGQRKGLSWNQTLLKMREEVDNGETIGGLWEKYFIHMVYTHKAFASYIEMKSIKKMLQGIEGEGRKDSISIKKELMEKAKEE